MIIKAASDAYLSSLPPLFPALFFIFSLIMSRCVFYLLVHCHSHFTYYVPNCYARLQKCLAESWPAVGIEILALYSHVNLPFQYQNQAPQKQILQRFWASATQPNSISYVGSNIQSSLLMKSVVPSQCPSGASFGHLFLPRIQHCSSLYHCNILESIPFGTRFVISSIIIHCIKFHDFS